MELNRADQETVVLGSYHVLSHISHAASQSPAADGATKVRSYRLSSSESPSVSIISPDLNKHQTHTTQTSSSDHTHTHTHTSWQEVKQEVRVSFRDDLNSVFSDFRLMFTCVYWMKRAKNKILLNLPHILL